MFDIADMFRDWQNWNIETFTPTGTAVGGAPGVEVTTQVSPGMNTQHASSDRFDQMLSQLQYSGQPFVDNQFPATQKSILGNGDKQSRASYSRYVWERPGNMFKGKFDVCGMNVTPNDVKQGYLGDCYFISAIASLAEYPERVRKLIISKDRPNSVGAHCVSLCITGLWEDIVLDDTFPYDPATDTPAFSKSRSNDLWIMLLEKAWAKVHGGYLNIESGYITEAFNALTGAPVHTYFIERGKDEELWQVLQAADQKRYIIAAATADINKRGTDDADSSTGLSGSHAYSVLSVHQIQDDYGQTQRLVKLRNPWGKGEWNGDWSDNSPKWSPRLRQQLGVTKADDGIFFMSFNDWKQFFHDFDVCHVHDDYLYSAKKYNSNPNVPTVMTFTLNRPSTYFFIVNQINKRMFRKADQYAYTNISCMVGRLEGGRIKFVGSSAKADEVVWFKANCQPGQYVAYIMTPWKRKVNEFSFAIYGPEHVNFETANPQQFPGNFVDQVLIDQARRDTAKLSNYGDQGEADIKYRFETSSDSFSYFYFDNKSRGTTLRATVQIVSMKDMEVLPPYSRNNTTMEVQPGEEKILVMKATGTQASLSVSVEAEFKSGGASFGVEGGYPGDGGFGGAPGGNFGGSGGGYGGGGYNPGGFNAGGYNAGGNGFGGGYGGGYGGNNFGGPSY